MKKFIAMLLALAMVLSLAACGDSGTPAGSGSAAPAETKAQTAAEKPAATEKTEAPAPAAEPVTLTWGSWVFAEDSVRPIYQEMADLYNETNEYNTTISTEYFYSYADYLSTLLIDVAGGNGPDVAHIKAEWLPQLLALGVVKPLDGYLSADVLADYSQSAIDSVTVDGSMMALPWFSNTYALLVNTDLCEQAGVDYTAIASWDDLLAAAEKISALGSDIYGLAIPDSNGVEAGEGYNTFPALWARGGEFEKDGTILLTSDESVAAYTDLQNLFVKKISTAAGANSFKELRNLFGAGKIGFYWDIESGIVTADEKMEAMGHFLDFMSGADVIDILYRNGQGKMSSRSTVMAEVFKDCTAVKQEKGGYTYAYVKAMDSAKALPSANIHFQDADAMLTDMLTELAQGGDVAEILAKWQTQIQNEYNK